MKKKMMKLLICTVSALTLAGCGSGGGGTGNSSAAPTQAVVYLSTQGTPSSQPVNGVQVTLTLPAGVAVAADANGNTSGGVVQASGSATGAVLAQGFYTPATSSAPATVKVYVVKTGGFNTGEFATVTCDLVKGVSPAASEFGLSDFSSSSSTVDPISGTVTDVIEISGLTPALSVDLK